MGSVYKEISRLETAKQDIETAIEYCGINVPDSELIDTYADYIKQIPSAVFSQLNADLVGGTDKFISSIKQTNGIIEATAGGLVSASYSGLVPKIGETAAATITTPADEWVLTSTKGAQPTWRKLPSNAFLNDTSNTTYTLSGALSGNTFVSTLTPSSGTNTTSTVPAMTGASSSTAGKAGLVPAPASGKQASFLRGDGTWVVPTNTKNTAGSTNTTSKIFLVGTTSQASSAQTYSNSGIHATDGVLTASGFVGNLTGNVTGNVSGSAGSVSWENITDRPTSFTPADHTHTTNKINALTGYSKPSATAALATTDTLNAALGKLEYKADLGKSAYDWYKSVTADDTDKLINKWGEIVGFLDSVAEGTDILDEFVTRKTDQTITGKKIFNTNTHTKPLVISRTGGLTEAVAIGVNDSQALFEYTNDEASNSFVFKMINTDTESSSGTGANESSVTFTGSSAGSTVQATTFKGKFISTGGTSAKFVKGDGSLDSNSYATTSSLSNYVTLAGAQTITGKKTFSNGLAITGGTTENTSLPYFLGIDAYADGGAVRYLSASKVCAAIGAAKKDGSNATGTWGISITGNAATATSANTATRAAISDNGVFYIAGTGSTAGKWLGSHSGITSYYTGLTIAYKIPVKGADTTTININNLGAKTIKRNDSNLTTHVPVNSVILLVYDGTYFRWSDYDANSYAYVRQYLTNSNNTEYPLLFRYDTEAPSSTYVTKYTRYDSAITVNPSTNTITATTFKGTATDAAKLNGQSASYYATADSLSNYVHKTVGGVQSILGGLVIGASSDDSQAVGRIMLTGNSNPLIGIRATGGTAFYFQSTGDIMHLGPTSSKALSFVGSTGAAAFPSTVTSSGFIKSGSSASYVLLGDGGHKAISDFLLKTELPAEELKSNVTTITKKLTVTKDWMDVGIAGTNLPANGTYIVQVSVTANDSTGNMWNCLWSGVMSWRKDATNDTDSDEILLHRSGHAYGNTLYLRTVMRSNSTLKLQIAANTNIGKAYTYTFKFKRIL